MDHQGVHKNSFQQCRFIRKLNWNLEMMVFEEGKTRVSGEKLLRVENQQQTQPT